MTRFEGLLEEMRQTHNAKSADYNPGEDRYYNLKQVEQMGIPAWVGVIVRLTDKLSRLQAFAKRGEYQVKDESVVDTAKDMAVYSLLLIEMYEKRNRQPAPHQEGEASRSPKVPTL